MAKLNDVNITIATPSTTHMAIERGSGTWCWLAMFRQKRKVDGGVMINYIQSVSDRRRKITVHTILS